MGFILVYKKRVQTTTTYRQQTLWKLAHVIQNTTEDKWSFIRNFGEICLSVEFVCINPPLVRKSPKTPPNKGGLMAKTITPIKNTFDYTHQKSHSDFLIIYPSSNVFQQVNISFVCFKHLSTTVGIVTKPNSIVHVQTSRTPAPLSCFVAALNTFHINRWQGNLPSNPILHI